MKQEIGVVLVTQPDCAGCKELEQIWKDLSPWYRDVKFITVDASVRNEVLHTYGLTLVPSVVFVDPAGEALEVIDGAQGVTADALYSKLEARGYYQDQSTILVSVNKLKQYWHWIAIGVLVIGLFIVITKKYLK